MTTITMPRMKNRSWTSMCGFRCAGHSLPVKPCGMLCVLQIRRMPIPIARTAMPMCSSYRHWMPGFRP